MTRARDVRDPIVRPQVTQNDITVLASSLSSASTHHQLFKLQEARHGRSTTFHGACYRVLLSGSIALCAQQILLVSGMVAQQPVVASSSARNDIIRCL